MEKRIIIASVLSVALILAWGYFMPHPNHNAGNIKKSAAPNVSFPVPAVIKTKTAEQAAKKAKSIVVSKSVRSIKSVSYNDDKIYARFNMPEGSVSGLNLLNYSYTEKNPEDKVDMANSKNISRIFDFIPNNAGTALKLVSVIKEKNSVKFIYDADKKIILIKKYIFSRGKYILTGNVSIKNISDKPVEFKGDFIFSSALKPSPKDANYINFLPIIYVNKSSSNPVIGKTKKYRGAISFAGFNSKYFLFAAISPGRTVLFKKNGNTISILIPKKIGILPGKTADISLKLYGGPKKLSLLTPLGHNLNSTLSYGFFGFFSIILLHVLEFFYGFVHNYGLAIILLVLAIRIVFYPLTYKGFKSMKQMQKLTPKINELRERYKDNKAELNKKIMELYKESRVNPFGGCLPMILQIPVFYGLYETLLMSIQLRNTPFILWIHNLSIQDPYYILPVLMGLSMLISQKMNPVIGDPTQAKIMLILPIVFTFIFIHFPAGLLLYWTVNNILTIAQQYIINRKFA